jgi:hypothetical protein
VNGFSSGEAFKKTSINPPNNPDYPLVVASMVHYPHGSALF